MRERKKKLPSPRVLRRLLDYDPETGELRWKERPVWMFAQGRYSRHRNAKVWNSRFAGKKAFTAKTSSGYSHGTILECKYYAHRIIWKLMTGDDPDVIDHEDGDTTNDRWDNLRSVEFAENMKNQALPSDNSSGFIGVSWITARKRWKAAIQAGGEAEHLGFFKNKSDAIAARKAAEIKYGFHPNHGRS